MEGQNKAPLHIFRNLFITYLFLSVLLVPMLVHLLSVIKYFPIVYGQAECSMVCTALIVPQMSNTRIAPLRVFVHEAAGGTEWSNSSEGQQLLPVLLASF